VRYALGLAWPLLLAPGRGARPGHVALVGQAIGRKSRPLVREYNATALKRDRDARERLFAPGFLAIQAYGYVDDRDTHIAEDCSDRNIEVPQCWTFWRSRLCW